MCRNNQIPAEILFGKGGSGAIPFCYALQNGKELTSMVSTMQKENGMQRINSNYAHYFGLTVHHMDKIREGWQIIV